jgi:predicted short-subunit dehydrogenase-like oxidoreductase (DUF2520 family)
LGWNHRDGRGVFDLHHQKKKRNQNRLMKIVCLGSGNVATHLGVAFKNAGMDIVQVWSLDISHASELALLVGAEFTDNLQEVNQGADLYLIAVKDDAIRQVSSSLKGVQGLVVHTSGATAMDVLHELGNYGVLYPLQTFSKHKPVDLTATPFCLEANSNHAYAVLESLTRAIGAPAYPVNSAERKTLHVAAVFASNFSNHLYHLANTILQMDDLPFDLLRPLILQTAMKVQDDQPTRVQTGPALRNDQITMHNHLELLKGRPELQAIYETLSNSIKKTHL